MKRLIVLSDGTGNSAAKFFKTNVWKLYEALDLSLSSRQIAMYDDGVGNSRIKPLALLGGAFGYGLKRNVLKIYRFLSRHYGNPAEPGFEAPDIYGFGFSRGAFTIRVVVGLIDSQGLMPLASETEMRRTARLAYRAYRKERFHTLLRIEVPFRAIRDAVVGGLDRLRGLEPYRPDKNIKPVRIHFLGLWDTVGAYGVPIEELHAAIDKFVFPLTFASRKLLDCVACARQALSIDDERNSFAPVPWERLDRDPERLKQVWFCGSHSNVGGGYADDTLSSTPLAWIVNEAAAAGLAFRPEALNRIRATATPFGRIYDSRAGLGVFYRYQPRHIPCDLAHGNIPILHESVVFRMATGFQGYAPVSLPDLVQVIDENGEVLQFSGFKSDARQRKGRFAGTRMQVPETGPNLIDLIARLKPPKTRDVDLVRAAILQRRFTYFGTLIPCLLLLFFPLLDVLAPDPAGTSSLGWLRSVLAQPIELLKSFTPGYLSPWFDAYLRHPGWVLVLAGVAIASYVAGNILKTRIADRARAAWQMGQPSPAVSRWTGTDKLADRLLKSKRAHSICEFVRWRGVPFAVSIAVLLFLLSTVDRTAFAVEAATGFICSPTADPAKVKPVAFEWSDDKKLDAAKPCQPTGLMLQEGQRYVISLALPAADSAQPPLRDGSLEADLAGVDFQQADSIKALVMALATPFRRILAHPWFAPVVRIGAEGNDDYPLVPEVALDPSLRRDEARTMRSEITARTKGELFFYVNDAYSGLLPLGLFADKAAPDGSVRHMYANNTGSVIMKVKRRGYENLD